jgi:hypothetical protein
MQRGTHAFEAAHAALIEEARAEHRLGWTAARTQLLRTAVAAGLTFSEIARYLTGATRNAAIGKAHRLGLCGRTPAKTPQRRPLRARAAPLRLRRPPIVSPRIENPAPAAVDAAAILALRPAPDADGALVDIARLRAHMCAYPIDAPGSPGFAFCARPRALGAYCGDHARLCYRNAAEMERQKRRAAL